LVTGVAGVANRSVVVGCEDVGVGEAVTTAVLAVAAAVLPPGPDAVTTQTILLPTSAAESA
jgi:hypothetical protein